MAASTPHPNTLTCRSRPGSQRTSGVMPLNMSSDNRERNSTSPIKRKSGSAVSGQLLSDEKIVLATRPPALFAPTSTRPARPVTSSASPTQNPAASSNASRTTSTASVAAMPIVTRPAPRQATALPPCRRRRTSTRGRWRSASRRAPAQAPAARSRSAACTTGSTSEWGSDRRSGR